MIRSSITFFLLSLFVILQMTTYGQTSDRSILPFSWTEGMQSAAIPTKSMQIDAAILNEKINHGLKNNEIGFVEDFPVSMSQEGQWEIVRGGKVCRLRLSAPGAKGMALYFDQFSLPAGACFHIYTEDKKQLLGAYTSSNNSLTKKFNAEIINEAVCILEYFEPSYVIGNEVFNVSQIGYIYKRASDFGQAGSCQVNVNCDEGNNYRVQQKAVCRILVKELNGLKWCTGTLVNNTKQDCTPYVLTAFHCAAKANLSDYNQWIFYYQYESGSCVNPATEPVAKTITGATLRAHSIDGGDTSSDFILCEINQKIPTMYDVTFCGWRKSNISSLSGVTLHHPFGDIKKISTYKTPTISSSFGGITPNTHWEVFWSITLNGYGVTQEGSSGAPLLDINGLLIGTLSGGASSCTTQTLQDYYGKLFEHFAPTGSTKASERLLEWLDPGISGAITLTHQSISNCPFVSANAEVLNSTLKHYFRDQWLVLQTEEEVLDMSLYDISGRMIERQPGFRDRYQIDTRLYEKGTYILELRYTGAPIRLKFIID